MMKKKLNKISGVTLIELLVGVAVTAIMMGAMFASYTAVNSSYKQVTDKARISSSSRDIVERYKVSRLQALLWGKRRGNSTIR